MLDVEFVGKQRKDVVQPDFENRDAIGYIHVREPTTVRVKHRKPPVLLCGDWVVTYPKVSAPIGDELGKGRKVGRGIVSVVEIAGNMFFTSL